MSPNYLLAVIFIAILQNVQIHSQICTETNMTWREVPETYTYTYMEAYEKTNCLFWCTDSRVATAVGTRIVRKQVPEQINVCCHGYTEEKSKTGNSFYCIPVCSTPCINGYCKSPEVCACNPGYLPDVLEPNKCTAMCIKDCDHGNCIAPNICSCEFGYQSIDGKCEPICQEACNNGMCIAPNTCQCHPGYKKSEFGICEPFCSNYTDTGECVVTITCEPGWEKDLEAPFETCRPICSKLCVYGKCVSPELCECFQGYKKSVLDTCEPYCSSPCSNGICMSPELCVCEAGYYKNESDGPCLPHCDIACGNGTCIAPNVCECLPGYVYVSNLVGDQARINSCVSICKKCEGSCRYPEECICEWPWKPVSVSSDGNICDCFDNCSITEQKCKNTVCLLFDIDKNVTNDTNKVASFLLNTTYEDMAASSGNQDKNNFEVPTNQGVRYNLKWLYAVGSVVLIVIIAVIAVILKKNQTKTLKSNGHQSSADEVSAVVHYKQSSLL